MINFDQISIDQISKHDFIVILQALDYTYEHTKIEDFARLKDVFLEELYSLTETKNQDDLIAMLKEQI